MSQDVGIIIEGDRRVAIKFDELPQGVHDALLARIKELTPVLAGRVRELAPERTGKLRKEIDSGVFDDKDRIAGAVFVAGEGKQDYVKAAALEYGAHGKVKVGAHESSLDHVFAARLESPLKVMVSAYTRQANIAAVKFLRTPIEAMTPEIVAALREATDQAMAAAI